MRVLVVAGLVLGLTTVPSAAHGQGGGCRNPAVAGTVEEQRLSRTIGSNPVPVAARLVRGGGLAGLTTGFARGLCAVRGERSAVRFVSAEGRLLWETAVHRARRPGGADDRPLYWARLTMALALRQWTPHFALSGAARERLEGDLEQASRGITSSSFRPTHGVKKLLVSGFDPFGLDRDIRTSNPSGAAVLRLDGRILTVGHVRVQVQAVVFPVRYGDFDHHILENAFRPHYLPGPQRADLVTTISQGRPGKFDLEVWNGRRRDTPATYGDNDNIWGGGTPAAPVVPPGLAPGPEFLHTSLPVRAMAAAKTGPFPVNVDVPVVEIPAGGTGPVSEPNGPTPGATAVEGSGGGYLSNESAYRNTLMRDTFDPAMPAGHLHTPVLTRAPGDTTDLTDPVFERNRADIVAQVQKLLLAALTTVR